MKGRYVQKYVQSSATIWPINPSPEYIAREDEISVSTGHLHPTFTAILCVWQPNHGVRLGVFMDEWRMKPWVLFIEKNKILLFWTTWTKLKNILLHEIRQAQKENSHRPHWSERAWSTDAMETVCRLVFTRHWKGWERMIRGDDQWAQGYSRIEGKVSYSVVQ